MAESEEWTADQIAEAIPGAIAETNWPVVEGLLLMLAARDPDRAELIYETMKIAVALRQREGPR